MYYVYPQLWSIIASCSIFCAKFPLEDHTKHLQHSEATYFIGYLWPIKTLSCDINYKTIQRTNITCPNITAKRERALVYKQNITVTAVLQCSAINS